MYFDKFINQILEGDSAQKYIKLLAEASRRVVMDEAAWIALIAHYLDLWELHGHKSTPKRIRPVKRTSRSSYLGMKSATVWDPETGEPTPEGFALWRGIDPDLFMRMFDKYKSKADQYRRTQQHRNVLQTVLRPDIKDFIMRFKRKGRMRDPRKTFKDVQLVASYLDAISVDTSVTVEDYAKTTGISASRLYSLIKKHRSEAEAYRYLRAHKESVPAPQPPYKLSVADRKTHKLNKRKQYLKLIPELKKKIAIGTNVGRGVEDSIKSFAKSKLLDSDYLSSLWNEVKEKEVKVIKVKPLRKSKKPKLFRGKGGYRTKRKGDDLDAWVELADDVRVGGLTDYLVLQYADLVGVNVIRKVKKFPDDWTDSDILLWMKQRSSEYIRLAKPELERKLKEMDLWEPPKKPAVPSFQRRVAEIRPQEVAPQKKNVLIIGGVKSRTLKSHPWIERDYNVHYIEAGRTSGRQGAVLSQIKSAAASGKWDLIIVMSAFTGHDASTTAETAAHIGTTIISRHDMKGIRSIHQAARGLKKLGRAEWFVNNYEDEKGVISDSMDLIVYNLLETIGLEILAA